MNVEDAYEPFRQRALAVGRMLSDLPLHEARIVIDLVANAMAKAAATGRAPEGGVDAVD